MSSLRLTVRAATGLTACRDGFRSVAHCFSSAAGNGPGSSQLPWRLGRLNHVAIATPDLSRATVLYRDVLGASVSEPQQLLDHGVTTVFVKLDNTKLELLEPLGTDSPITKFLARCPGGGMHHVCLEVDDLEAAMRDLTQAGVRCLSKQPMTGAHGKPVVFLHPKDCDGVLLELEQA